MVNETIIDEDGQELSIYYNEKNELVLVIETPGDPMLTQVIKLTDDDVEWIIKTLQESQL